MSGPTYWIIKANDIYPALMLTGKHPCQHIKQMK